MKVELIDYMGSDLTVVNAARVSFDKEVTEITEKDEKLIKYLAKHNHWTPFAHPQITMRETVPIFVARQRFRHTVGFAYNEVSRRYVDNSPEFFIPDKWRSRPEGGIKQGSGGEHPDQEYLKNTYNDFIYEARLLYSYFIMAGVAPEQARMILPQAAYTSYYVTGSLAAWARAYKLRIDSHAQLEIQELAKEWGAILSDLFPVSWKALVNGDE